MDESDILRAAHEMMAAHGSHAAAQAVVRAHKLLELGDTAAFHAWTRVADAIADLDRKKPNEPEEPDGKKPGSDEYYV
jgi:hypothetical protein